MYLLPFEDRGTGPKMSNAIHSKGTSTLYRCSLPWLHFSGPLRAEQPLQVRHYFSTSSFDLLHQKRSRTFLKVFITPKWPPIELLCNSFKMPETLVLGRISWHFKPCSSSDSLMKTRISYNYTILQIAIQLYVKHNIINS